MLSAGKTAELQTSCKSESHASPKRVCLSTSTTRNFTSKPRQLNVWVSPLMIGGAAWTWEAVNESGNYFTGDENYDPPTGEFQDKPDPEKPKDGTPPKEENKKEDCVDEADPSYLKITPIKGVKRTKVLKKVAKKDPKTGKMVDAGEDVTKPPHQVYEPAKDAKGNDEKESEWKIEFKYCVCGNAESTVVIQGLDKDWVQDAGKDGYTAEEKKDMSEARQGYPQDLKFKLTKTAAKCCPDKVTQLYWYCGEGSWTAKIKNTTGRRLIAVVYVDGKQVLAGKIRQGDEKGDEAGEWSDVK